MNDKRRRIGGSDLPKLLEISPYGNSHDVYLRIVEGLEDPAGMPAQRGILFEPVLRDIGFRHFGLGLEPTLGDYWRHPSLEFAHAQVDDLAIHRGREASVNYKTANVWTAKKWGPDGSDKVPEAARVQVAWEMLCTGRQLGILLVGFGEDGERPEDFQLEYVSQFFVERDERYEDFLVGIAEDFWNAHILPRRAPSVKPIGKLKDKIRRAA